MPEPLYTCPEIRVDTTDSGLMVSVPPRYLIAAFAFPFVVVLGCLTFGMLIVNWLFCRDAFPKVAEKGLAELLWVLPFLGMFLLMLSIGAVGTVLMFLLMLRSCLTRTIEFDLPRNQLRITHLPCCSRVYSLSMFTAVYSCSRHPMMHGATSWVYLANDSETRCLMIHYTSDPKSFSSLESVAAIISGSIGRPRKRCENAILFGSSFFFP
ncbi:MAG: hypothetical protein EXS05_08795 [Planctomycetaceae bacterium]|nr:hypothetical protein [Planctomycetaceae bacterium]